MYRTAKYRYAGIAARFEPFQDLSTNYLQLFRSTVSLKSMASVLYVSKVEQELVFDAQTNCATGSTRSP